MNVAYIETTRRESATIRGADLTRALDALTEGGIEFEVVCSGTDTFCPDLQPSAAA
jgi:hypothetical protein